MSKGNLGIIKKICDLNFKCYQTDRFNLDNELMEPYDDHIESEDISKVFENTKPKSLFIEVPQNSHINLFKYFLDGSRYTYKIADMQTSSGEYMPIVAGQIGVAICSRNEERKMKKEVLNRRNLVAFYNHINGEDFIDIKKIVNKCRINNVNLEAIKYKARTSNTIERPENAAIAKILSEMHKLEISSLRDMVNNNRLSSDSMLIMDGSLRFIDTNIEDELFDYVIGVCKSFNPNQIIKIQGKNTRIGSKLDKLKFGYRTPVLMQEIKGTNRIIGTWYLRIRPTEYMRNPLDGIIKVEKIAVQDDEKDNGFDTTMINTISTALLLERNSTCYGKDSRWCNHLYPVYLTEKMLKDSFISEKAFLNYF